MSFWKWEKPKPAPALPQPEAPAPPPELDELAKLLPEQGASGRFFWQDYADRLIHRFGGLPAPDGGESFVRECLAAGCDAVPAAGCQELWEHLAPPASDGKERAVFEVRVRLGLFLAASLRYAVHGASRLRVRAGDSEWQPMAGFGPAFREFQAPSGAKPEITWANAAPNFGHACLLAHYLFQLREVNLLGFDLARDVYVHILPGDATGLFCALLRDGDREDTDVAGVFLDALVQAARDKRLRVNTRRRGHVFVTPPFWFVTYPVGVGDLARWIERRRKGPRHRFTRDQIVEALRSEGCLFHAGKDGKGKAVQLCEVDRDEWLMPLSLNGLLVRADRLPGHPGVSYFDGTVFVKESGG